MAPEKKKSETGGSAFDGMINNSLAEKTVNKKTDAVKKHKKHHKKHHSSTHQSLVEKPVKEDKLPKEALAKIPPVVAEKPVATEKKSDAKSVMSAYSDLEKA